MSYENCSVLFSLFCCYVLCYLKILTFGILGEKKISWESTKFLSGSSEFLAKGGKELENRQH